MVWRLVCLILLSIACMPPVMAQAEKQAEQAAPLLYFILDASGSMWGELPGKTRKITVARQVLRDFLSRDFQDEQLAFRFYGHRRKGDCRDSELVFPPGSPLEANKSVVPFFEQINPKGKTPITYSLKQAAADLQGRAAEIVLITDGLETCDSDPCELVRQWQAENLALKVHVVGFGLKQQENDALRCLADTSGGEFFAAASAEKLAESLVGIHQVSKSSRWTLAGQDEAGATLPVAGTLRQAGKPDIQVNSRRWFRPALGTYKLVAGVPTKNGTLYQPVEQEVTVDDRGDTRLLLTLKRPPQVRAAFVQGEETVYGSLITAYQDGKQVFSFRPVDQVFVQPGDYEFRSEPNADNKLRLKRTIREGETAVLTFRLQTTVKVKLKMIAADSDIWFRENYELWQEGEKRYQVHVYNGARVLPGTYDVRLPSKIAPYIHKNLVIDTAATQEHELKVPSGHVTITYGNVQGEPVEDKRIFLYNLDSGGSKTLRSGQKYPLVPGNYRVIGWPKKHYDPMDFEVKLGTSQTLMLRAKS